MRIINLLFAPRKTCLFSLSWKTTCLERPLNSVVAWYRFHYTYHFWHRFVCTRSSHHPSVTSVAFHLSLSVFQQCVKQQPLSRLQHRQRLDGSVVCVGGLAKTAGMLQGLPGVQRKGLLRKHRGDTVSLLLVGLLFDLKPEYSEKKYVYTMAADALAPCVAKSSASKLLTMQDKCTLVLHKEGFQQRVPSQSWEMI